MSEASTNAERPRRFGKYEVFGTFARGGMASIHVGRLLGPAGFSKLVAVKQVSPLLAKSERHAKMLLEEARLTARIRSGNVVPILDVIHEPNQGGQLCIVMELVRGVSLGTLLREIVRRGKRVPPAIASAIVGDALRGLHAAHEATDARGKPLNIIHRDVSPHNLIVGADGVTRVLDFGIAKGLGSEELTSTGEVKGKPAYMPHEQLAGLVTRQSDVYAAGIVLWEALVGERLRSEGVPQVLTAVLRGDVPMLRSKVPELSGALEEVVATAVAREASKRYATAEAMLVALEEACPPASRGEVARFVEDVGFEALESLDEVTRTCETSDAPPESQPASHDVQPTTSEPKLGPPDVAGDPHVASERVVPTWMVVAAAAIGGIALAASAWSFSSARDRTRAIPEAHADDTPPASKTIEPATPPLVPVASAPTAAAPSAVESVVASAAPSTRPPVSTRPRPAAPAAPAAAKTKAACTPPYEYDDNGRKHYKRECLP